MDVTNETDNDNRRGLEDGDGLNDFLLVCLGANSVELTNNVSHTSLVGDESSQVNWFSLKMKKINKMK